MRVSRRIQLSWEKQLDPIGEVGGWHIDEASKGKSTPF
jgi:hypothetical protein